MKINVLKTGKVLPNKKSIYEVLDKYIKRLEEKSVVAVTSKIVSICEGRVVPLEVDKEKLAKDESEYYYKLPSQRFRLMLTVRDHRIMFTSGIDKSNSAGDNMVLLPKDPQKSANEIRKYLQKKFRLKRVGVIITDTTSSPLLRGQRGFFLSHSGFDALNNYVGKPDVFGRKLTMTKSAVADALATAAVLVMGEGAEQTPLAIIEDAPFIRFRDRNPSRAELKEINMDLRDDLFYPLLKGVKWKKGGRK